MHMDGQFVGRHLKQRQPLRHLDTIMLSATTCPTFTG